MRVVVVYESMFGNTRKIAEAVAAGAAEHADASAVPISDLPDLALTRDDVVVVGAPTHVHGLPGGRSRDAAAEMTATTDKNLVLDASAAGPGVKEWLRTAQLRGVPAAAFDTRFNGPRPFTGSAARRIAHHLRRRGAHLVVGPESFLVDRANTLLPGELDRARRWGEHMAGRVVPAHV